MREELHNQDQRSDYKKAFIREYGEIQAEKIYREFRRKVRNEVDRSVTLL